MARQKITLLTFIIATALATGSLAFVPSITASKSLLSSSHLFSSFQVKESLTDDGGVQKEILYDGTGEVPEKGTKVFMSYSGSLAPVSWSPQEVVDCWLSEQQGLDHLKEVFLKEGIDEAKLTDADTFTEDYVTNTLGVESKIQCKKLVSAAKRLATTRSETQVGHIFDTNPEYSFELGSGKLIKGMELGVATMKPGEWSIITIRSNYGYGSEGYRKPNGDVVVPPFASLNFEVQLYPDGVTDLEGYEAFLEAESSDFDVSFDET